jgi:hypothetical protein
MSPSSNRARITVDPAGPWAIYWGNRPLPEGSTALGVVNRGVGDAGALLRTPAGLYVQGNAGVLRNLDHRKVVAALDAA